MSRVRAKGAANGRLMRAALKFLVRAEKRNRPGRMTPHFRRHVFGGHERPGMATGSGYHYRPGGEDFPGRRLVPGTQVVNKKTGVYQAEPQFFDPTMPPAATWKPKGGNNGVSTFFPDHWTPAQVDAAIHGAFGNSRRIAETNTWEGVYGGIRIQGYYNGSGGYTHGWPVFSR